MHKLSITFRQNGVFLCFDIETKQAITNGSLARMIKSRIIKSKDLFNRALPIEIEININGRIRTSGIKIPYTIEAFSKRIHEMFVPDRIPKFI